jgi:phosphonoacetaldehyde hydrolase
MRTLHPSLPARIEAFVFDWAGTTVDYGCHAPVVVFQQAFRELGVEVSDAEARGPMGMAKWDHLQTMLQMPRIAARFREVHGREGRDADVDAMYARFLPLQVEEVSRHALLVPGFRDLMMLLRERGIAIGSTTGYPKEVMARLLPLAAEQGYAPRCALDATDVRFGRPKPWLVFRAMELLDVHPPSAVVVVDDTPVGVRAGVAAGCFTVGVVETSNGMGLTREGVAKLRAEDPAAYTARYAAVERSHIEAGAHLVVPSVASLVVDVNAGAAGGVR